LQQASQRRRHIDSRHIVLGLKLFNDGPKRFHLAISKRVSDTLLKPRHSLLVDRSYRG
jgi:hypothetical protein